MPDPEVKVEPVVEPKVEPKAPEPEAKVEPKVEPKTEPKVEPKAPAAAGDPPADLPKKDWKDSRIAELTAKLNQERAKKVEPPKGAAESEADFNARVEARAQQLVQEKTVLGDWDRRCNEVFAEGKSQFADFDSRVGEIKKTVDAKDPDEVQRYNTMIAAAMETGKAAELLHELGGDIGEARRLMALPPMKLAVELAQRAAKIEALPEPSGAPKPITPIGSGGVHYEGIAPDDANRGTKLPIAQWMALREKQARERGLQ
jgi:hypothetical protein